ncbi:MAG TPA: NAD(P)/FAD-dependent oxidoreductase [Candidatus Corynebacterium avicola]|uniref:NAD(P)/FAD-dependent oxidoreductase n=1 Tax=Candidatus Corynebacterium avicola TaxID=2838527 RepID=A0A9D1ULK8_9CORY|nr:NAD(P)/FAD-dependent oxidoreductase [Candidatus Corynebacterium avicola]
MNSYDTIIIGGGVAGLEAAQMLGRARRNVLVLDSGAPRNRFAPHMHGVLGLDGTPPLDLLARGREEAEGYGVTFATGVVDRIDGSGSDNDAESATVRLTCTDGTEYRTRAVLVATGLDDDLPDIPGLAEHWGGAAFQCPYCHGWEVRDTRIGVLATSPPSFHQATLIRQWSDSVTVFTTDPALFDGLDEDTRAGFAARGVSLVASPVTEVLSASTDTADSVSSLRGVRTQDGQTHEVDALAVSPESRPRDGFLAGLDLERYEFPGVGTFLQTDETGRTSHPRIWATGNVVNPRFNVPASVGQASMAAGALNHVLVLEDTERAVQEAEDQ